MKSLMLIMSLFALYSCDHPAQYIEQKTDTGYSAKCKNMTKDNCNGHVTDPFSESNSDLHENSDADLGIAPDQAGFVIIQTGRASLADKKIPIMGRFQVYVRNGSQYAYWRQFPAAIYFEVVVAPGKISVTPNYSRSISDDNETYKHYANMPADQMVGANFRQNIYYDLSQFISVPGVYKIRALYFGQESNWLEIVIEP